MHAALKRYARKYQAAPTEEARQKFAQLFAEEYKKFGQEIPNTHERIHHLAKILEVNEQDAGMLNAAVDVVIEQAIEQTMQDLDLADEQDDQQQVDTSALYTNEVAAKQPKARAAKKPPAPDRRKRS